MKSLYKCENGQEFKTREIIRQDAKKTELAKNKPSTKDDTQESFAHNLEITQQDAVIFKMILRQECEMIVNGKIFPDNVIHTGCEARVLEAVIPPPA